MKKFLLSLMFFFGVISLSSAQCISKIFANNGGGGCSGKTCIPEGGGQPITQFTTSIRVQFAFPIVEGDFPKLISVTDVSTGEKLSFTCVLSTRPASNAPDELIFCFFGSPQSQENFLNATRNLRFIFEFPTRPGQTDCTVNIGLPVDFKSISATRNKSKVDVKWTTATESNNRGFNVQRNTSGVWENVAFVFSAATGGHSTSDLSYSFSDANATKGVTQYRVQQVDIDGKSKLSEIRSVKGETMASSMVVYPNPSETGKINVVFEDQSLKSVQVSDMSGRIVRSLKGVSNNVAIEGLETGVYSIQVTDLSSAAVSVEKVIIKKR